MSTAFTAAHWSSQSNIYEVNLRQYTQEGTFRAFEGHLPRLRDMGIEILWFMPVTPISLEKRKGSLGSYYACSDYCAVNPEFGSMEDFRSLVSQAHQLGFRVIIDWVANHTGWDHHWTREHPEYYARDPWGNFTERNGWDDVIDLDFGNSEMRTALIDAMQFWITTCDIDGFRCDMAHLVPLDFWIQARSTLQAPRELFWLAECEEISYHQAFDATYTWKWMHQTEAFCRQQAGLGSLWDTLKQYDSAFPPDALRAYYTSNHDENSWNGTEYEKYGAQAACLAVFSCLWNGLPLIYSGQELPNYKRLQFFDRDPIQWTGHCALHGFYKGLLALRRRNPALRSGDIQVRTYPLQTTAPEQVFSFCRQNGEHTVIVLLNFSAGPLSAGILDGQWGGIYSNAMNGQQTRWVPGQVVELDAHGYLILEK